MKKIVLTSIAFGYFAAGNLAFADTMTKESMKPSSPVAQSPSETTSEKNTPAAGANLSQWKPYTYVDNGFSVMMLSEPQHTHQELDLPNSHLKIPYDIYVSDPTDKTSYLVGVAEYPKEVDVSLPENNLKAAVNGTLGSTPGGKLLSSEMSTVANFPAVDFSIEGANYNMKGRYILKEHTLYQLMLAYDKTVNVDKDYDFFIRSFKITK